jgi:hypothetical protein
MNDCDARELELRPGGLALQTKHQGHPIRWCPGWRIRLGSGGDICRPVRPSRPHLSASRVAPTSVRSGRHSPSWNQGQSGIWDSQGSCRTTRVDLTFGARTLAKLVEYEKLDRVSTAYGCYQTRCGNQIATHCLEESAVEGRKWNRTEDRTVRSEPGATRSGYQQTSGPGLMTVRGVAHDRFWACCPRRWGLCNCLNG